MNEIRSHFIIHYFFTMSFICPECQANSLAIAHRIELPPDGRSDEIALQIVKCGACGMRGTAVYKESRRGSLDSDSWHHNGYRMSADDIDFLQNLIQQCPDPGKDDCQCRPHLSLGKTDERGIWHPPRTSQGMFPMIRRR
ncbi:MAG: hypothetical protein GY803_16580 [Chloroflexi bacterium]|nr:hypothetical protein [Chloroflexota bacterium]